MNPTASPPAHLVGRDQELQYLAATLERATSESDAVVGRIVGDAGIGKSVFLGAATSAAERTGWTVVRISCYEFSQQRQSSAIAALVTDGLRVLGKDASTRYTGGLEAWLAPYDLDRRNRNAAQSGALGDLAFVRLFEAILVDRPVILAVDDAHWIDSESARALALLLHAASSSALAVIMTQRTSEFSIATGPARMFDLELRHLDARSARAVVAHTYPAANDEVVSTILGYAGGSPLVLATLAEQAARDQARSSEVVSDGFRSAIRLQTATLTAAAREFVQSCSLLRQPIDMHFCQVLCGNDRALSNVLAQVPASLMVQEQNTLRFAHALVLIAVRETIRSERTVRRRLIETLSSRASPSIEVHQELADQARATGDWDTYALASIALAEEATARRQWRRSADAYRDAFAVRAPTATDLVFMYRRYVTATRLVGEIADSIAVLKTGIREARRLGVTVGVANLSASLVSALCEIEETHEALAAYRYYVHELREDPHLSNLHAAAANLQTMIADGPAAREAGTAVENSVSPPDPTAIAIVKLARAQLEARVGQHETARTLIDEAKFYGSIEQSVLETYLPLTEICIEFESLGPRAVERPLPEALERISANRYTYPLATYLHILAAVTSGQFDEIDIAISDIQVDRLAALTRRNLLAVAAMGCVVTDRAFDSETAIVRELEQSLDLRYKQSFFVLASWWAGALARRGEPVPAALRRYVTTWWEQPSGYYVSSNSPVPVAMLAAGTRDTALLEKLAALDLSLPHSRWQSAHRAWAQGIALAALGSSEGRSSLVEAAAAFEDLGAFAFAAAARRDVARYTGTPPAPQDAEAGRGRTAPKRTARAAGREHPTPREMQVARLVAEGKSNREIAETLVLSERTVEVHIANLFGKIGVRSRTQLTGWLLTANSQSAS